MSTTKSVSPLVAEPLSVGGSGAGARRADALGAMPGDEFPEEAPHRGEPDHRLRRRVLPRRDPLGAFAEMMMHRRGHHLDAWMAAVDADDLPELHSFVAGLRSDHDAARAGLNLRHSSGPVEGHSSRIND
ncbi:hypothetical protein AB0K60_13690 [Thermopolyspora sp. NPDC052614]|uniref:hypothetical protein n=1 Tax=Thermopolyspora sp. NPDC052614 TaxID=3155682 RepID=UPI0034476A52